MPKVTFIIDGETQTVEFEHGEVPYSHHGKPESFLDVAKHFHIPLEHACGGSCACTTCHVIIKEGEQNLSGMEDDEADRYRKLVINEGRIVGGILIGYPREVAAVQRAIEEERDVTAVLDDLRVGNWSALDPALAASAVTA